MIFVNLPVTDLKRSMAFYEAIGAANNPQFSNDTAAMMSFSSAVNVMILTHERFNSFTDRKIIDAHSQAQVLLALSRESRAAVDAIVDQAVGAGGSADPTPKQEFGEAMYGRSFTDPDGHIWEVMWMDVAAMTGQPAEQHEPAAA
ncbi:MAG: VOC family protein [Sphingomonas sp.]